ncbi:polysaccharide biosynthesis protein [Butyrivibrio sp. XB500-5]|uniref:oligosaccharide flippase family protein n=1 Tax=Butyrivibrio sp. XB500-5 TaxID=2364880 RepID=UPI000EAAC226|nr:oligosaccharide flippase family protein [Butyrivibrio sp. XB500-5]RKM59555.1 polysaccharide biosynthesis protein [Butyrivibrio sp. XB500-5]
MRCIIKNIIGKFEKKYKNSSVVVRASFWFWLVAIIDKSISIITQPIINRILTVEEVGVFGTYSSWNAIFSVLATFNLFGGVLEVYLTKEEDNKNNIIGYLCSLSLLISAVIWSVILVFGRQFSLLLNLNRKYLFIMAVSIVAEAIIQFWIVPRRFEYAYKAYAIMVVSLFFAKSVLSVLLSFWISSDRVLGRILGLTIPAAIVAVVLLVAIFKNVKWKGAYKYWKAGILFNLPLIPHYLCSILLATSDKVMIQRLDGQYSTGLYTVAYSFSSLALIVFNALNSAYNPMSMKCIKEKNYSKLSQSTSTLVFLSVVFSVYMMLFAPEGIMLLGGKKYLSAVTIIPTLIVGIFFSSFYFVFSNIEFVYEKTKYIFPVTLFGALVNISLNYLFIPIIGYQAAAYTTLLGYAIVAVLHYVISKHIIGSDVYDIKKIVCSLCLLFLGMGGALLMYKTHSIIRYIFIIVVSMLLGYGVYKKKINLKL